MAVPPYPLHWPENLRRTATHVPSQFRTGLSKAMENVRSSIRLFGSETGRATAELTISSNAVLGDMRPGDPGVAVWFLWDGDLRCIAVDRYRTVEENLQAIHHVIEARRTEMRHAGIEMVRATFKGFTVALPAPGAKPWPEVLGVPPGASVEEIRTAYKAKARSAAERNDQAQLQEINVARDIALKSYA